MYLIPDPRVSLFLSFLKTVLASVLDAGSLLASSHNFSPIQILSSVSSFTLCFWTSLIYCLQRTFLVKRQCFFLILSHRER
jgi:hypothetical protein